MFTPVRFGVQLTFSMLALCRNRLRDCGEISVYIVGHYFKCGSKSKLCLICMLI